MSQYINTPPSGYQAPQRGTQPVLHKGALTSLILALLAIALGPLTAIPAIIVGIIALVGIKKSNGAQTGKGMAITGVTLGLIYCAAMAALLVWVANSDLESVTTPLDDAERVIGSKKGDKIGSGNTEKAESMAVQFAQRMKTMRAMLFTGAEEDDSGLSSTGGEFLTFCQLNNDSCVFLVHVPKLRKYESDAQDSMADLAWMVAGSVLKENGFNDGFKMAVGTKGVISYARIDIGNLVSEQEDLSNPKGVERSGEFSTILEPFFPAPSEKADSASSGDDIPL